MSDTRPDGPDAGGEAPDGDDPAAGEATPHDEAILPEYDWSAESGETTFRQWRTRTLAVAVALVGALAVADHLGHVDVGLTRLELLTVVAGLVAAAYLLVPLLADRTLTLHYWRAVRGDPVVLASLVYLLLVFVLGVFGPPVIGHPDATLAHGSEPPVFATTSKYLAGECLGPVTGSRCHGTFRYPLGTNAQGQDMLKVVALGARVAVEVALVTGAILVPLGVVLGLVAGYRGGLADDVLMRAVDVQGAVPAFLVYLVLAFVLGRSLLLMVVVFGLLSWGKVARLVRSEVLQLREEPFVLATRGAGASQAYVVRNTLLPNVSGTVLTAATRQASTLVLLEAALSFMELGEGSTGSWGQTISLGVTELFPRFWWISLWPVVALTLTVVALNVVGDAARDVLAPQR